MTSLKTYQEFLQHGDFADVYLEESQNLAIRWEEGKIESVVSSDESGVGLRIVSGEETRFAHTDLANPFEALQDGERARMQKLHGDLVDGLSLRDLPPLKIAGMKPHPIKKRPESMSIEQKMNFLRRGFEAANTGPHIRQINVNYGEKVKRIGYVNSDGDTFIEERIYTVYAVTVTVERQGDLQNAYESMGGVVGLELFDGDRIERLGKMVGQRAHLKLYAPQAPLGPMPVVIASSAGGTLIHEAVGHSLEADAVSEGTSPAYIGKLGHVVGNEKLNVYDNPTVPSARGSFHFDDEGVPAEATKLIENGVLKDYMFDRLSAKRMGRLSNGHGRRESYAHRPIPRMSNTYVAPGPDDPEEILKSLKYGLLVTKMGGGQVNTANGDFVFEVEEGFQIKDGKRTLVRGATLLGNGPEVLKMIDMVGSDHGWAIGTCGKEGQGVPVSDALPTIRVKKLVVGGQ